MSADFVPVERRVMAGSLVSAISFALSILQTLIQVPLLLRFWSPTEYGMWVAVLAATSLVTRLDIGHQSFIGNLFCRYWVEDRSRLKSIFSSAVLCACLIALVELLAGILMFFFGHTEWLSGSVAAGGREDFRIAFFAYLLFWVAQGSVGGILVRLYQPAGLFSRAQIIAIIYYLAGFVALVTAAALGASIAGAMLAQIGVWVLCNLFMFWDVRRLFPEFYPWWKGGDLGVAWKNFRASLVLTVNALVDQMVSSGLVLLVMGVLAPVEVAVFTTIRTVANTALQGVSIILYPIMPDVVRYHVHRECAKLVAVFGLVWCVAGSLVCLGFSIGAPILEPLYSLWTRKALPFNPLLFSLIVLAVCFRQWATPLQTYLHGVNNLPPQTVAVISRTVVTLTLAWIFLSRWGIAAAGWSLLAGECLAAVVYFLAARRSIIDLGGGISTSPVIFSLLQIFAMAFGLFFCSRFPSHAGWGALVSASGVLLTGYFQWRILDPDVKKRVLGLLTFHKNG